jgi:hypothetical protein
VYARVVLERAAARIEGPLVFLKRTLEVGLNEAGGKRRDGRPRLGARRA